MRAHSKAALLLASALFVGAGCTSSEPAPPPAAQTPPEGPVRDGLEPFQPVIGKSVDEAHEWLVDEKLPSPGRPQVVVISVRPIKIDGQELEITEDLRSDRLNVIVEKGVITALDGVY